MGKPAKVKVPLSPPWTSTMTCHFTAVDYAKDIECSVCLDVWSDPVELQPCRHVFCRACIRGIPTCPECRRRIERHDVPNRILLNMANEVTVECGACQWRGKRETAAQHRCCGTPASSAVASTSSSSPAPAPAAMPAQQQQQQQHPASSPAVPPPQVIAQFAAIFQLDEQIVREIASRCHGDHDAMPAQLEDVGGNSGRHARSDGGHPPRFVQQPPSIAPVRYGGDGVSLRQGQRHGTTGPHILARDPRPWEAYSLSQVEYDQIFSLFMHFDNDDSGELDRSELGRLARWLNFCHTEQDVDRMFQQMDIDRSGTLSMPEFCTWLKHNKPDPQALYGMPQMDYNYILMQFHSYDTNNNGELDATQFVNLCTANRYAANAEEAMRIFNAIDVDRSGAVDLHEFLTFRAHMAQGAAAPAVANPSHHQQHHHYHHYHHQQQHAYQHHHQQQQQQHFQVPRGGGSPPPLREERHRASKKQEECVTM